MKLRITRWNNGSFIFRCGWWLQPCMLYEKATSKATSAEPPPRWAIGTGQLSCLQFRSGPIARRGGGGIIPFGSASTTQYSLCPLGHVGYMKYSANQGRISSFVVGRAGSEYGLPVAVISLTKRIETLEPLLKKRT